MTVVEVFAAAAPAAAFIPARALGTSCARREWDARRLRAQRRPRHPEGIDQLHPSAIGTKAAFPFIGTVQAANLGQAPEHKLSRLTRARSRLTKLVENRWPADRNHPLVAASRHPSDVGGIGHERHSACNRRLDHDRGAYVEEQT